jgi:hypothetical protein
MSLFFDGSELGRHIYAFVYSLEGQFPFIDHFSDEALSGFIAYDDGITDIVVLHILFQPRVGKGDIGIG